METVRVFVAFRDGPFAEEQALATGKRNAQMEEQRNRHGDEDGSDCRQIAGSISAFLGKDTARFDESVATVVSLVDPSEIATAFLHGCRRQKPPHCISVFLRCGMTASAVAMPAKLPACDDGRRSNSLEGCSTISLANPQCRHDGTSASALDPIRNQTGIPSFVSSVSPVGLDAEMKTVFVFEANRCVPCGEEHDCATGQEQSQQDNHRGKHGT